ncbi:hypothetical protein GCM10017779_61630 [Streptomyces capillispiralis]|nr:hypothetical protein GCM10017779_61630 [Streptomyces capillispiralis]
MSDLTTLLLKVFRRRADRLSPADVMRRALAVPHPFALHPRRTRRAPRSTGGVTGSMANRTGGKPGARVLPNRSEEACVPVLREVREDLAQPRAAGGRQPDQGALEDR